MPILCADFKSCRFFCVVATVATLVFSALLLCPKAQADTYSWSRVAIGGGGNIPQLLIHPKVKDVLYARGDVEGLFRWDAVHNRWVQLLDWLSTNDTAIMGCEGIAVDPNDTSGNIVYASFGQFLDEYRQPAERGLWKSTDRGDTWTKLLDAPVYSNGPNRFAGESIAIDPSNSSVVYYGSSVMQQLDNNTHGGFYTSTNAGANWALNTNIGQVKIDVVAIDPRQGMVVVSGVTRTKCVYLGRKGTGIYKSTDGGITYSLMSGTPVNPNRIALQGTGTTLLAADDNGLYLYNGSVWSQISGTSGTAFRSVSVDPANSDNVVANGSTHAAYSANNYQIWRSSNGGQTFVKGTRGGSGTDNGTAFTWINSYWNGGPNDIVYDPFRPGTAWTSDSYGTWETGNVYASTTQWTAQVAGQETQDMFTVLSPPAPAKTVLYTGMQDVLGFRHTDLSTMPTGIAARGYGSGSDYGTSIAVCERSPTNVVFALNDAEVGLYTSTNDGASWTGQNSPGGTGDHPEVAIAAVTANHMVWMDDTGKVFYSANAFAGSPSWNASSLSLPSGWSLANYGQFSTDAALCADMMTDDKFYLLAQNGTTRNSSVYISTDGGAHFTLPVGQTSLPNPAWPHDGFLHGAPGIANSVWYGAGSNGLFSSADGGATFSKCAAVKECWNFAFGAAAPGTSKPTLFVVGKVTIGTGDSWGAFRSVDLGATWVQISDAHHQCNDVTFMAADRQVYGRVYICSAGSGTQIAQISSVTPVIGNGNGLSADYYQDMNFYNLYDYHIPVSNVNFFWGAGAPEAGMPVDHFSIIYSGYVQPSYFDTYTFYVNSDDGARLYLNNQLILDNWHDQSLGINTPSQTVSLQAGAKYNISLQYYEDTGDAGVTLLWSSPNQAMQVIPQSQLYISGN